MQVSAILGPRAEAPDFYEEAVRAVSAILLDGIRPREGTTA